MIPALRNSLVRRYPDLYRLGARALGFNCGDGWFDILDRLSAVLEPTGIVAKQVKEKFGALRFYTDRFHPAIGEAESESGRTCMWCGSAGEPGSNARGWLVTWCRACAEKGGRGRE